MTADQRRKAIIDAILDSVEKRGYPPSTREICDAVGLTSTSSVHALLKRMVEEGLITKDDGVSRGLRVVGEAA